MRDVLNYICTTYGFRICIVLLIYFMFNLIISLVKLFVVIRKEKNNGRKR